MFDLVQVKGVKLQIILTSPIYAPGNLYSLLSKKTYTHVLFLSDLRLYIESVKSGPDGHSNAAVPMMMSIWGV
jgi:hypothetical protein